MAFVVPCMVVPPLARCCQRLSLSSPVRLSSRSVTAYAVVAEPAAVDEERGHPARRQWLGPSLHDRGVGWQWDECVARGEAERRLSNAERWWLQRGK